MSPVAGVLRDPQASLPTAPSGGAGSPSKYHLPMLIMPFGRHSRHTGGSREPRFPGRIELWTLAGPHVDLASCLLTWAPWLVNRQLSIFSLRSGLDVFSFETKHSCLDGIASVPPAMSMTINSIES